MKTVFGDITVGAALRGAGLFLLFFLLLIAVCLL